MAKSYNIPRNYKGEDKILFIFSRKSFIYTVISVFIGLLLRFAFVIMKLTTIGNACLIIFALIGFAVGTFKVPETQRFKFTQKLGGESIDDIIVRYIKFKKKNNRIYVYKEEEQKNA